MAFIILSEEQTARLLKEAETDPLIEAYKNVSEEPEDAGIDIGLWVSYPCRVEVDGETFITPRSEFITSPDDVTRIEAQPEFVEWPYVDGRLEVLQGLASLPKK